MDALGISFVDVDLKKAVKDDKKQRKAEKKRLKKEKKESKKQKRVQASAEPSVSEGSGQSQGSSEAEYDGQDELPSKPIAAQRDSWMTSNETSGRNILTGELQQPKAAEEPPEEKPVSTHKAKELNPDVVEGQDIRKPPAGRGGIGDGGASWRLKALKRAQAIAEEEGRNVEEIVSDRFGSLDQLTKHVTNERAAHSRVHLHAQRDRERQREGGEDKADYLQDVGSNKAIMRQPDARGSLSWRKKSERAQENSGRHSRDTGDRRRDSNDRDSRPDHRARDSEHRQSRGDRRSDKEKSELLAKVASKVNTFSNDGSFMDKFDTKPQRNGDAQRGANPDQIEKPSDRLGEQAEVPLSTGSKMTHTDDLGVDGDNKSAAARLRARLLGKKAPETSPSSSPMAGSSGKGKKQVEMLPAVDAEGRAMPGTFGRESAGHGQIDGGRKVKRMQRYQEGEKQQYFRDDNRSLDELVREQRHHTIDDMDANLADNIARKARFRERDLDVDEEYDVDGGLEMYESRNSKVTKEKAAKRQRIEQISDAKRLDKALENCNLCFGSKRFAKQLLIAIGQVAYLSIPERGRLHPHHCIIAPTEHVSSSRKVDEHVWTEMRNFKKCVIQMNANQGFNTLFWETAMRLGDQRSHAVVHAVPLDDKAFHKASVVFKKSLDEAESEWSQHQAKAVIDTRSKGLRGSIPANFPYFFVEFGLSAGYAHVIDDEDKFDKDFGRSIVAGLLKLDAGVQKRAAKAESSYVQEKLAEDFTDLFEPFDWTKQLE